MTGMALAPADEDTLLADSVSRALLVVLDRLSPAQRVAFVLHDVFTLPFEAIAAVLERSPAAAKKLACERARRPVDTNPPYGRARQTRRGLFGGLAWGRYRHARSTASSRCGAHGRSRAGCR